ncbi:MAG: RagB/SusD family nutrient uptake outer membrane protein [Bacteroidia bacterium]|nr:RagB/SusD family nutrient uptake outer membrane protein [Bacteroidia bacterium]
MNTFLNKISARRISMAAAVLFFLTSCQVTDLEPIAFFSETTAFSTADRAELAAIGMYNAAQSGTFAGGQIRGYPFGAANVEQGDMRGEDMVNQALFYQITYEATYTPFSANNVWMWNTLFALINQANIVIEGSRGAQTEGLLPADVASAYEAEGRFMRAMAYHELLIHFARPYLENNGASQGVPIRSAAVTSASKVDDAIAQGRNTVAEVYAFILEDLDFCESALPDTRNGIEKSVRATKGAAIALKTRVKLHKGDWAGVISEGNKIVSTSAPFSSPIGGYTLDGSLTGPYSNTSAEAVFYIDNSTTDNPGVNGALPAMLGNPAQGGRGLVLVSPQFYNNPLWLDGDLRRTLLSNNGRSYFTDKYVDKVGRSDSNPILRYAEVLLNVAEAEARNGGSTRALDLLNAVRNRAVTEEANQFTAGSFATANELIAAILMERRIEFLAEGKRWGDIHRLANDPNFTTGGIPSKIRFADYAFTDYDLVNRPAVNNSVAAIPYSDFRFLWPIPADELAQNPTLAAQQNPGY